MKNTKQIYVIENLEKRIGKWALLEYKHISKIVGKNNLWFTNIKRKNKNLEKLGSTFKHRANELNLNNSCILDPEAKKTLSPSEAKKFTYFIFGGILGDYPPKKRTKKELTCFFNLPITRNIGKKQMSTDNAVYTVKEIASGKNFSKLKFKDTIEIKHNSILSMELPYRYNLVNNKPLMTKELLKYLKNKKY